MMRKGQVKRTKKTYPILYQRWFLCVSVLNIQEPKQGKGKSKEEKREAESEKEKESPAEEEKSYENMNQLMGEALRFHKTGTWLITTIVLMLWQFLKVVVGYCREAGGRGVYSEDSQTTVQKENLQGYYNVQ